MKRYCVNRSQRSHMPAASVERILVSQCVPVKNRQELFEHGTTKMLYESVDGYRCKTYNLKKLDRPDMYTLSVTVEVNKAMVVNYFMADVFEE